jgi:hypothetical protein
VGVASVIFVSIPVPEVIAAFSSFVALKIYNVISIKYMTVARTSPAIKHYLWYEEKDIE